MKKKRITSFSRLFVRSHHPWMRRNGSLTVEAYTEILALCRIQAFFFVLRNILRGQLSEFVERSCLKNFTSLEESLAEKSSFFFIILQVLSVWYWRFISFFCFCFFFISSRKPWAKRRVASFKNKHFKLRVARFFIPQNAPLPMCKRA